jgi:hypothetical protein
MILVAMRLPSVPVPTHDSQTGNWEVSGHRIVGHGGGAPGVNAMLQIYPDIGYSVIGLSNFDPPAAEEIAAKAREVLLNAKAP